MTPRYTLSKKAAAELKEIIEFTVSTWGQAQAIRYLNGMESLFELLSERPMIGRDSSRFRKGLRRIEHASHVVFYTIHPDCVRIDSILHKNRAIKRRDFSL